MKQSQNINQVDALGIDYMGFIFYSKSKRDASEVHPDTLTHISAKKVGVFVNESLEFILKKTVLYRLDAIQLHGDESPLLCKELLDLGLEVFKVFSVGDNFDFDVLEPYKKHVSYFLFDTKGKERGGNGYAFDWELLKNYDNEVPLILSGGLNPTNINEAFNLTGLNIYALDLNSGFEIEPGLKNIEQLEKTLS